MLKPLVTLAVEILVAFGMTAFLFIVESDESGFWGVETLSGSEKYIEVNAEFSKKNDRICEWQMHPCVLF
jgi:hypothetical protein